MPINPKKLALTLSKSGVELPSQVTKRDGSVASFDIGRIESAVTRCYESIEVTPTAPVVDVVTSAARAVASRFGGTVPHVEQIQDMVEMALASAGEFDAMKHYILYREEHARKRETEVPDDVRAAFEADKEYFPTPVQQFQFYDKYSRYNWDKGRRETWRETVDRNVDYLRTLSENKLGDAVYDRIHHFILTQQVMPSMRSLAQAGAPALRNSLSIYNCSFMPVIDINVFVEAMLVSMAGCGVGFSVERRNVEEFPRIKRQSGEAATVHIVEDTTEGWAEALRFGLGEWFEGRDVEFNYDWIRPAGTPLLTKGGRASGPDPLKFVLNFCRTRVLARQGSFLRTIDAHDMMCAVGGAAVSGGVRRTAMISLFDWDDDDMRTAKDGDKLSQNPVRWNANNSAVWPEGLSQLELMTQMLKMASNDRGEPGIFSRINANATRPERRAEHEFGTNPCGEINLRRFGLCNLTIAVARAGDEVADLMEKVEIATIIGTIQSLATTFPGMREDWKRNCEEERLLGVDITGQQDCPTVQDASVLAKLKKHVIAINKKYAAKLGINQSAATTCDKPSGNSSLFLNCASGIHTRWSKWYTRRTRVSAATPLYRVLRDAGVPLSPENGQDAVTANTWVASWPVASPEGSITRKDRTAVEQCDYWLMCKTNWTEHNPSVTITYQPDELLGITNWIWEHRDLVGGMAFLPADNAAYDQLPYEEITEEQYLKDLANFPEIDYSLLYAYEHSDMTTAASELACLAGNCDV